MNSPEVEPGNKFGVVEQGKDMRLCILNKGNWAKPEIFIHKALHNWVSLAQGNVHLDCALTVPNIMNLLLGYTVHVSKDGRQVIVRHMLVGELPKLFILVRVVFGMVSRMFVTSAISQPNIIAPIGQHKGRCFVLVVDKPGVRTIKKSMLKDDGFESVSNQAAFPLYPENSKDVSILSDNLVGLNRVVIELAVVNELQLGLRMSAPHKCHQHN
jgi:hypothetical protein